VIQSLAGIVWDGTSMERREDGKRETVREFWGLGRGKAERDKEKGCVLKEKNTRIVAVVCNKIMKRSKRETRDDD